MYQRSNEKANTSNNDTSRKTVVGLKQKPNPQPSKPTGLAAAVNSASKQEEMMPGHRLREKATGMCEKRDFRLSFLS
jgi:hypothetical protein